MIHGSFISPQLAVVRQDLGIAGHASSLKRTQEPGFLTIKPWGTLETGSISLLIPKEKVQRFHKNRKHKRECENLLCARSPW